MKNNIDKLENINHKDEINTDINHKEIASNIVYAFTNKSPYKLSKMANRDFQKVREWIKKITDNNS